VLLLLQALPPLPAARHLQMKLDFLLLLLLLLLLIRHPGFGSCAY
jgi:hypothetical protein